ncbi:MAG: prolyl-tRNA synthetase associated domain-containing protein [Alphaproteobacteria bacterium]
MKATEADLSARFAALGIETRTHAHPPLFTVEDSRALRGDLPGGHCKNLFLKAKNGSLWLVVALEDTAVDLKALSKRLGAGTLSFGRAELLWEMLGVEPGSVTPFALINDRARLVQPVLEAGMMALPLLNYHPLRNDRTTAIASVDLARFIAACGHEPIVTELPVRLTPTA